MPSVAAVPWLAEGYHPLQVLTEKWRGEASPTAALTDFLRVSAWALFPVLPLAVLCRWRERSSPFLRMVTGFALFAFVSVFVVGDNEEDFYLVLPPLAILAARAIQTAPNDVARILDFFASLVVGFVLSAACGGCGWLWIWACRRRWTIIWRNLFPVMFMPGRGGWRSRLRLFYDGVVCFAFQFRAFE